MFIRSTKADNALNIQGHYENYRNTDSAVIPVVILESPDDCGLADHHSTLKVLLLTCSQRSGRQGTYLISRQSGGHGLGAHQTSHAGDNSYSPPRSSSLRLRRDPL